MHHTTRSRTLSLCAAALLIAQASALANPHDTSLRLVTATGQLTVDLAGGEVSYANDPMSMTVSSRQLTPDELATLRDTFTAAAHQARAQPTTEVVVVDTRTYRSSYVDPDGSPAGQALKSALSVFVRELDQSPQRPDRVALEVQGEALGEALRLEFDGTPEVTLRSRRGSESETLPTRPLTDDELQGVRGLLARVSDGPRAPVPSQAGDFALEVGDGERSIRYLCNAGDRFGYGVVRLARRLQTLLAAVQEPPPAPADGASGGLVGGLRPD